MAFVSIVPEKEEEVKKELPLSARVKNENTVLWESEEAVQDAEEDPHHLYIFFIPSLSFTSHVVNMNL